MTRSILSPEERQSSAWHTVKEAVENRINVLRLMNDKDRDPIETAKIRGGIKELIKILDKVEPKELQTSKPKRGVIT